MHIGKSHLCHFFLFQRKITEANTIIQDTGLELMNSAEELYHARQVQKNIVATLETLNKCIPGRDDDTTIEREREREREFFIVISFAVPAVLLEYHKLNEQMMEKQYYSALKTLEQLEHTLLPPVKGYIFSDLLSQQIPQLRQSIQDSSKAELTVSDFSLSRTHSISPIPSFPSV